jgi:hypothetical protein
MHKIKISFENASYIAELYDTDTARAIVSELPISSTVHTWGDEIYFSVAAHIDHEMDASIIAEVGELGYWPDDPSFCIFFGPTPISTDSRPRAISPVNIFGKVNDSLSDLNSITSGEKVLVKLIS